MTGRRTFGPLVLVGLGSAALASVAASKAWTTTATPGGAPLPIAIPDHGLDRQSPLAASLALVVLAAWGVLLVTRGWVRRVLAGVALLAAGGVVATTVEARSSLPDAVARDLADLGLQGKDLLRAQSGTTMTGWWIAALVAGVICVLATSAALRFVRDWPEMGTRYDAPTGAPAPLPAPEDRSSIDLWKSLDAGQDPTLGPNEPRA
ncbi:Trp biosynthesis-associated membrane protein [Nocardioides cavernaquae]|uniref:Trp biosynthesis-associated membrane protein n=1 Tax=Nocardioides cavernaquae TaxID=2321396 RepID=UPI00160092FA|nr:Trp biosynthesis-associated membrane protein [Nocardioides cavernaquae]